MKSDTSLLDWLEEDGFGFALVSDDNGHWACVSDGIQNVPMGSDSQDMDITFWIEKDQWKNTIREAIQYAIDQSKE